MHTSADSSVNARDIDNFFLESLNNDNTVAAPADTIRAWPDGNENLESSGIKKPVSGINGLGLSTISFAAIPIGIRVSNTMDKTNAVFLPLRPPKTNNSIVINTQNKSLPYRVRYTMN